MSMSLSNRGRLIYEQDDRTYLRNVIGDKIFFYFLMTFPIFATIFLGAACILGMASIYDKGALIVLVIIWTVPPFLAIFVGTAGIALAGKLQIYENGFVPARLPVPLVLRVLTGKLRKEDVFVRYEDIDVVGVERFRNNDVAIASVNTKDGLVYTLEKAFLDQESINKLVEVIRQKRPEVIKEMGLY